VDEVLDHPLLDLISNPNGVVRVPRLSRFDLLELTQLSLDILGRAYWQIIRDGLGRPSGLWPLAAQFVEPVFDEQGMIDAWRWTADRPPRLLSTTEVISFQTPDLQNPLLGGMSPAKASFARIGLAELYVQHQQAVLENRARPDLMISPSQSDGVLGESEARRLESAFNRRFQGGGIGGIFVSRDSVRVDPLRYPERDLGELTEHQASLEQIARTFDIPLSMLNRDANRASAEQGRAQHASDAVAPRLARIQDRLNQHLVPLFDASGRLFLRFDDPVKENLELKLRTRASNLRHGFTTINEERAEEGYPPVPWGNQPLFLRPEDT
jgi:HK97 family phage portal protein